MSAPKPPFHSVMEELLYEIFLKIDSGMSGSGLTAEDINTLAKLNAILTDADLMKAEDVTVSIDAIKGSVPVAGDTLEKLFNIIQGLNYLTAEDIDTLAELNAIISDANVIKTEDLTAAINALEFNQWKYADLGNVAGATIIDLSGKAVIKFTHTGNITDFNFSNEQVGRQYVFIIERTVNSTLLFAPGRWSFPFGIAPSPTNPVTNGSAPAFARDIWTALCLEPGRLTMIPSNNFLPN